MNARLALVAAPFALFLAGCLPGGVASDPPQINVTQVIGDRYVGGPVQQLMVRYGAPRREMKLQGETIYTWEREKTMHFEYSAPLHLQCQLDVYVKPDGVIRTLGVSGKQLACEMFLP